MRNNNRFGISAGIGAALLIAAFSACAGTPEVFETTLFTRGEDGYLNYRIPALLTTQKGTVLAFCEARQGGDSSDIDLMLRRSEDGGETWQPRQIVWDEGKNVCGNPCVVEDRETGVIWLLMCWNDSTVTDNNAFHDGREARHVYITSSSDDGRTWAEPKEITDSVKRKDWWWYATGPGIGIQLQRGAHKGRLVIPCDFTSEENGYASHIIYSDDHGATWQIGGIVEGGCNENQVVELADGRLMMNARIQVGGEGKRGIAFSRDGGESWSELEFDPTLIEPVCQASIIRYTLESSHRKNRLLFSNPASRKREKMTVRLSYDEGETWPVSKLLHKGPSAYSCLTVLPDGMIGCLYEGGQRKYGEIVFAKFSLEWLTGGNDSLETKPNVLLITIDDMNDGITLFGEERPFKTPNIERLAGRGVFFSRAYCSSPACNPSRASVLTGKRPHLTGIYGNKTDWRNACRDLETLPEYFRKHGYNAASFGKVYHHHWDGAFNDPAAWDHFRKMDLQYMPKQKLNQAKEYGSKNTDWGAWPSDQEEAKSIDYKTVNYAIEALQQEHDKPFLIACGIYKPHSPFYAPPRYHRQYQDALEMPVLNDADWDDLPTGASILLEPTKWFWKGMMALEKKRPGAYRDFIEAYAACCSFSDASVGRLIDALDKTSYRDNTIIVLWSDHGFHLGEKDHIEKFALWEKTTHIPFIIVDPRLDQTAGETCGSPVDMTTIYPTLVELCGLPHNPANDGLSVALQVKNPDLEIGTPALMTYGRGNHAVRTKDWRYIQYADGSEELYCHDASSEHYDPNEWTNLADQPEYKSIIDSLKQWIPTHNAPQAADLKKPKKKRGNTQSNAGDTSSNEYYAPGE